MMMNIRLGVIMALSQYGILKMTNKIQEQDLRSVHRRRSKCGALTVHAKKIISEIVEKNSTR